MKATLLQNTLVLALKDVVRSAATRSTLSVLQNILLEATEDGYVHLSATNLEYGIRRRVLAVVQEAGAITVPAKTFNDMIATLDGEIELTILARGAEATRFDVTTGQGVVAGVTDPHLADDVFLEYMRVINAITFLTAGVSASFPGAGLEGTVRGTLAGGDLPVWLGGFVNVVVNY